MPVLRAWDVNEKAEDRRDVRPIEETLALLRRDIEGRKEIGHGACDRTPLRWRAGSNREGGLQQHRDHDRADQEINDDSIGLVRAGKARRSQHATLIDGHRRANHHHHGEQVLEQADRRTDGGAAQRVARKEPGAESVDDRGEQNEEGDEDQRVQNAGERTLQQPAMKTHGFEHTGRPSRRIAAP